MLKVLPVLIAAGLLAVATPAFAADADSAPKADTVKDATAALQPAGDNSLSIIVIERSPEAAPNPYGNPSPQLLSDAWAQRT